MKRLIACILATAALASAIVSHSVPAFAGRIVLSPKSGGFDFEGELKKFDGASFLLETPAGTMKFPASGFDCTAGDCPDGTRRTTAVKASTPVGPAAPQALAIYGASSIGNDLIPALIRAFGVSRGELGEEVFRAHSAESRFFLYKNRDAPTVDVNLQRYGTAHGLQALAKGDATIAMAGRPITQEEIDHLPAQSGGAAKYDATVVGLDAVAVLVSPKRNIESVTLAQLAAIFSGKVTDWSQLGSDPGPINLYAPDVGNGSLDIFTAMVLAPQSLVMSPLTTRMDDFPKMSDQVAADPTAMAIVSMAFKRESKALALKGSCGLVTPLSPFTVKAEEYPMGHRSYLYTTAQPPRIAADFIHFTQGKEAQTTVADKQFVNQTILAGPRGGETPRLTTAPDLRSTQTERTLLRRLATDLEPLKRLSATMRFASGTSQLDERATEDVRRLAQWMTMPDNINANAIIAGFTDHLGSVSGNVTLSLQRAEQVRQSVLQISGGAINPQRLEARGYGPVAPVACDNDDYGQNRNRRVEVWIR